MCNFIYHLIFGRNFPFGRKWYFMVFYGNGVWEIFILIFFILFFVLPSWSLLRGIKSERAKLFIPWILIMFLILLPCCLHCSVCCYKDYSGCHKGSQIKDCFPVLLFIPQFLFWYVAYKLRRPKLPRARLTIGGPVDVLTWQS